MRILIIIVIIAVLLGFGYYFLFYKSNSAVPLAPSAQAPAAPSDQLPAGGVSPSEGSAQPTLTALDLNPNLPKAPTFYIGASAGSVQVKNFYLANPVIAEADDLVLYSAPQYSIFYAMGASVFNINFVKKPDVATRNGAEAYLLSLLGISKTDACKLAVWETVGYGPGKASLSFCGSAF